MFAAVKSNLNGVTDDESLAEVSGTPMDSPSPGGVDQVTHLYSEDRPPIRSAFAELFVLGDTDQLSRWKSRFVAPTKVMVIVNVSAAMTSNLRIVSTIENMLHQSRAVPVVRLGQRDSNSTQPHNNKVVYVCA